jgi:hypothetical protein
MTHLNRTRAKIAAQKSRVPLRRVPQNIPCTRLQARHLIHSLLGWFLLREMPPDSIAPGKFLADIFHRIDYTKSRDTIFQIGKIPFCKHSMATGETIPLAAHLMP